jgi:hypothetical protein
MTLNTTDWEAVHGHKPRGSHLWEFAFRSHLGTHLISTDGPWAATRDRVLEGIKETHGNVEVRLVP